VNPADADAQVTEAQRPVEQDKHDQRESLCPERSSTARLGPSGLLDIGFMVTLKLSSTKRYRAPPCGIQKSNKQVAGILHDGLPETQEGVADHLADTTYIRTTPSQDGPSLHGFVEVAAR